MEPELLALSQALHLPDRVLRVQHREQVLGQKYINQEPKIYQSRPQNISIKTLKYIHQSEKIFNRWWGKVRGVPEVENPLLVLSGLAMASRFFLQFFFVCLGLFLFVFGSFLLFVNIVNGNQGAPVWSPLAHNKMRRHRGEKDGGQVIPSLLVLAWSSWTATLFFDITTSALLYSPGTLLVLIWRTLAVSDFSYSLYSFASTYSFYSCTVAGNPGTLLVAQVLPPLLDHVLQHV